AVLAMPGVSVGTPSNEEKQTLPARKSRLRMAVPDRRHCVRATWQAPRNNVGSNYLTFRRKICSIAFNACCKKKLCTTAQR
ncbi:hypothetical protein, partial [Xanthomonas hortorum]|uniref:hypothetical protein n=1 Tax=Xanthomonas hortorum TaxID=56454 RepID=UPI003EDA94E3